MDQKIEIEKNNIEIEDNIIRFKSKMPIINFAACWGGGYDYWDYVKYNTKNIRAYGNIPPIQYTEEEDKYHLKIELFQNGFVRKRNNFIKEYFVVEDPEDEIASSEESEEENINSEEEIANSEEEIKSSEDDFAWYSDFNNSSSEEEEEEEQTSKSK